MGRAGRAKRHDKKMRARRTMKAARRAAYAALRGTSKKSKKIGARRSGPSPHKHMHLVDNCGNIGCGKCFPEFIRFVSNGLARPAHRAITIVMSASDRARLRFERYLRRVGGEIAPSKKE